MFKKCGNKHTNSQKYHSGNCTRKWVVSGKSHTTGPHSLWQCWHAGVYTARLQNLETKNCPLLCKPCYTLQCSSCSPRSCNVLAHSQSLTITKQRVQRRLMRTSCIVLHLAINQKIGQIQMCVSLKTTDADKRTSQMIAETNRIHTFVAINVSIECLDYRWLEHTFYHFVSVF